MANKNATSEPAAFLRISVSRVILHQCMCLAALTGAVGKDAIIRTVVRQRLFCLKWGGACEFPSPDEV